MLQTRGYRSPFIIFFKLELEVSLKMIDVRGRKEIEDGLWPPVGAGCLTEEQKLSDLIRKSKLRATLEETPSRFASIV